MDRVQTFHQYPWHCSVSSSAIRSSFVNADETDTILAIGSYYDVCAMSTEQTGNLHTLYFQKGITMASNIDGEYTVDNVRLLLLQSFFFLLKQWTDRCWLTLGLAIRIAQSIGLHVERHHIQTGSSKNQVALELQRRTWHSLYVLDRYVTNLASFLNPFAAS